MMWIVVLVCLCAVILSVTTPTDVNLQLGRGEYRVEIDSILEPTNDTAVYRVRVWTAGEQAIYLDLDGGQITQPLTSRLEDGGLWQADLVILVNLRPNPDVTLRANASQMESRLLQRGKGGITFTDNVDAGKKLNDLVEVTGGTTVQKPGTKHQVARLNGKVVEVWAAASRG